MTQKLPFLILFFAFSCNNKQTNSNTLRDTPSIADTKKYSDSLDFDKSDYITTNFPDTVGSILYKTSDSLLGYIKKVSQNGNKELWNISLYKILGQQQFQIDSSQKEIIARKRFFNKREMISWYKQTPDTVTTQVICWHLGKKYILIGQHWDR